MRQNCIMPTTQFGYLYDERTDVAYGEPGRKPRKRKLRVLPATLKKDK